jgi:hypothetical protein
LRASQASLASLEAKRDLARSDLKRANSLRHPPGGRCGTGQNRRHRTGAGDRDAWRCPTARRTGAAQARRRR